MRFAFVLWILLWNACALGFAQIELQPRQTYSVPRKVWLGFTARKCGNTLLSLERHHRGRAVHFYTLDGLPCGHIDLRLRYEYDGQVVRRPYNFFGIPYLDGQSAVVLDGNGATWFDTKGFDRYRTSRPLTCPPLHVTGPGFGSCTSYSWNFDAAENLIWDGHTMFLPVDAPWRDTLLARDWKFLRQRPEYFPSRYVSGAALVLACRADTQGLSVRHEGPHLPFDQLEYQAAIGRIPELVIENYRSHRLNFRLMEPKLAADPAGRRVFLTTSADSLIFLFSYSGEQLGVIPKLGWSRERLSFFEPEPGGIYRGEETEPDGWRDFYIQFIRNELPPIIRWTNIHYACSQTDEQLAYDPRRNWLYRLVAEPGPLTRYEDWNRLLGRNPTYVQINRYRPHRLQVYDLNAGGRLVSELEVSPGFRIVEVDAAGDLWAVTRTSTSPREPFHTLVRFTPTGSGTASKSHGPSGSALEIDGPAQYLPVVRDADEQPPGIEP